MESIRDPKRVGFFRGSFVSRVPQPDPMAGGPDCFGWGPLQWLVGWLVGWLETRWCVESFRGLEPWRFFLDFDTFYINGLFELFELFCWANWLLAFRFPGGNELQKKSLVFWAEFLWFFLVKFSLAKNVDLHSFKKGWFFFTSMTLRWTTFQTPSYLLIKYRHSGTVWILKGWISRIKTAQKMGRFFRPHGSATFMHVIYNHGVVCILYVYEYDILCLRYIK